MTAAKKVLFVCTGNSCRSVMAEAMLKKMLGEACGVEIKSAGIGAMGGLGASENTITVLFREGIDASGHKSTFLTRQLINESDMIIAMEQFHEDTILNLAPDARDKVFLLAEKDVPDPMGKPIETYERVLEMIKEGLFDLIIRLKKEGWIRENKGDKG